MSPYLIDLVDRMSVKEPPMNSEQSVSWHALREAELLDDAGLIPQLAVALQCEKDKSRRGSLCFVIGKIGKNTRHPECTLILLKQVTSEKDKYLLHSIFNLLADLPKRTDQEVDTIVSFWADSRHLIRHSAISALGNTDNPHAELAILRHLAATTDAQDQIQCHAVLSTIGTLQAIPLLERALSSRKRDVKAFAVWAIRAIHERDTAES